MHIPSQALQALKLQIGEENVRTDRLSLLLHAYDCSLSRMQPDLVLHLSSAAQVAPVIKILNQFRIPFVARAAATNHAGSCSTPKGGAVLNLSRLNRILQIHTKGAYAWVEPGVVTEQLQQQLAPLGFFYAPDPASQKASTLGGNLAQNASGARCLKYGGTLDHVLEADVVLPSGEELHLRRGEAGPDWLGILAGSEGTLGIVTRLKVKILPQPKLIKTFLISFPSLLNSVQAVTDLVASGIIPRCVEAMDHLTLHAIEEFSHAGYPVQAQAVLVLELDDAPAVLLKNEKLVEEICRRHQATQLVATQNEEERQALWKGRQTAYSAMARLAPNVLVCDGTVPRSELANVLQNVRKILEEHHIRASLLFHAADGNFHPQIIFDERNKLDTQRINRVAKLILRACVDAGGTISGEHGIGVEKRSLMPYQYDEATLNLFSQIKSAFDPHQLANPLKIIPLDYSQKVTAEKPVDKPTQKIAEQVRQYRDKKTPFSVVGTNTVFRQKGTSLSLHSFSQLKEIDLTNYTATAQCGISLHQLARALQQKKVCSVLPDQKGTLGGAFSSGKYPGFYAHVTGLKAVLPDGSVVSYGGKLTKNAAGYNLIRLFAGAQGGLGVVTELTFKIYAGALPPLRPAPVTPLSPNTLWHQLKNRLDPQNIFRTPQEKTNG